MLATANMAGIYVDTSRAPMETYTPQVENISPTPEDQPVELPGKKVISEKLEKVEREIKQVDTHIRQLEKHKVGLFFDISVEENRLLEFDTMSN